MTAWLRDCWYLALPSRAVGAGRLVPKVLLGEPLVFGRDSTGKIFALRNICPHRGIPLHHGWIEGVDRPVRSGAPSATAAHCRDRATTGSRSDARHAGVPRCGGRSDRRSDRHLRN
jgi:hypothetical protein